MPPLDPQAAALLREAFTLDEQRLREGDIAKARQLLQQASDRGYWPAMHLLAWIYAKEPNWRHDAGDAINLLEAGIRRGIPDAYYRMGNYYRDGAGLPMDQDKAHAFWQKAAYMGSPAAMTELAKVMSTKQNNTIGNDLVNLPVATSMLECAMGQGYGDAGEWLAKIIEIPKADDGTILGHSTPETVARSLRALQDGVRLGCAPCASVLYTHFHFVRLGEDEVTNGIRKNFYMSLHGVLSADPHARFPDLDKAMPLPPASIPATSSDISAALELAAGDTHPSPNTP